MKTASAPFPHPSPPEDRKLIRLIERLAKRQAAINRRYTSLHPPDPPNRSCRYAMIRGFFLSNARGQFRSGVDLPEVGDLRPFFKFGHERAFVWTYTKDHDSAILVKVDEKVREQAVWRTLGTALRCYVALTSAFEYISESEYVWIYDFKRKLPLSEQDLGGKEVFPGGSIHTVHFWADNASILELLERDEKFYVSVMHLLNAFEAHWFCLHCAFAPPGEERHPHPEANIWELADLLPRLEVATVQATKAVEGILGKPGNRDTNVKLQRVLNRWTGAIGLDPNEQFKRAEQSYLDYYYSLFDIRGSAAHGLGSVSLRMTRRAAVLAQMFSFIVLMEYKKKRALSEAAARTVLSFNQRLLRDASPDWETKMTRG